LLCMLFLVHGLGTSQEWPYDVLYSIPIVAWLRS
jgi:hypothetical protein